MLTVQMFQPRVGEPVLYEGQRFRIREILSLSRCILQSDRLNERPIAVDISALAPVPEAIPGHHTTEGQSLEGIPEKHLNIAHQRLEIIRPLVAVAPWPLVCEIAKVNRVDASTLYRWLKRFRESGLIASLVPGFRLRGGPLGTRLTKDQETAIEEAKEHYLTAECPEVTSSYEELKAICHARGIEVPSLSTLHNRIKATSLHLVTRARKGKDAARALELVRGKMPEPGGPWGIILIDHTPLDVIQVDRETRQSLGRAFITVAMDAATRMIVGFYISLDHPSALSVGLCMARAMLPKEAWLARLGVSGDWPVWGTPRAVHVDNGDGFRSEAVRRACKELGFDINFRRVGHPQDGGMVERFLLTLSRMLHHLPGTTFSNPQERGEYDSEKKAAFTLDELERYIAEWIVNVYHQKGHSGLKGKSPIQAWNQGILGVKGLPGLGIPVRHVDEQYILLRFLPVVERTVQKYGLDLWYVKYWSDHLRHWVGAKHPANPRANRKFTVRYDPRDLSQVWFLDPNLNDYIKVSYADTTRPPINYWELQRINKTLRAEGAKTIDEHLIFSTRDKLRRLVSQSVADTKTARKERERLKRREEATAGSRAKPAAKILQSTSEPEKTGVDPRSLAYDDIDN